MHEVSGNHDFLLTKEHVLAREEKRGRIAAGFWVLMRSNWSKRNMEKEFLTLREDGCHIPGPDPSFRCLPELGAKARSLVGIGTTVASEPLRIEGGDCRRKP